MIHQNSNESYIPTANIKPLKSMGELVSHFMEVRHVSLNSETSSEKVRGKDHIITSNSMSKAGSNTDTALGMDNAA